MTKKKKKQEKKKDIVSNPRKHLICDTDLSNILNADKMEIHV